eukprot:GHVS01015190.1.p1 GENE.GHVS01015190.1~~GHVS01015190.1.p1  ORF type:complete len:684 (-),score=133.21 GHVS01015190.1:630-2597(-)
MHSSSNPSSSSHPHFSSSPHASSSNDIGASLLPAVPSHPRTTSSLRLGRLLLTRLAAYLWELANGVCTLRHVKELTYVFGIAAFTWPIWGVFLRRCLEYRLGKLCLYYTRMYKAQNMPKRLILLRHAQSEGNVSCHMYEKKPDSGIRLTDIGHAQAFQSGVELYRLIGGETFKVYCSPYTRAKQTINGLLKGYEKANKATGRQGIESMRGGNNTAEVARRDSEGKSSEVLRQANKEMMKQAAYHRQSELEYAGSFPQRGRIDWGKDRLGCTHRSRSSEKWRVFNGSLSVPSLSKIAVPNNNNNNNNNNSNRPTAADSTSSSTGDCSDDSLEYLDDSRTSMRRELKEHAWQNEPLQQLADYRLHMGGCGGGGGSDEFPCGLDMWETRQYKKHCDRYDIQEEVRLREQETGFGKRMNDLRQEMPQRAYHGNLYYRFFGGESGADVYDRVSAFVEKLHRHFLTEQCASNFIIVSHGATIKIMLMRLLHWTVEEFQLYDSIRNAEVVVLEKTPDCKFRLRSRLRRRIPAYVMKAATPYDDRAAASSYNNTLQQHVPPERTSNSSAHRVTVTNRVAEILTVPKKAGEEGLPVDRKEERNIIPVEKEVELAKNMGEVSGGVDCKNMDLSSCIGEDGGGYGFSVNLGDGTEGFLQLGAGGKI